MAPSAAQELAEHELRIEQMQTNIEKMRADMRMEDRKMRMENRRFLVQIVAALAVAAASGAGVMNYLDHRILPPAAATRG
jgi:hypothetical protein